MYLFYFFVTVVRPVLWEFINAPIHLSEPLIVYHKYVWFLMEKKFPIFLIEFPLFLLSL